MNLAESTAQCVARGSIRTWGPVNCILYRGSRREISLREISSRIIVRLATKQHLQQAQRHDHREPKAAYSQGNLWIESVAPERPVLAVTLNDSDIALLREMSIPRCAVSRFATAWEDSLSDAMTGT